MQEINHKDYYIPDIVDKLQPLVVTHSLNKFEGFEGVVEITKEGTAQHVGVRTKDVLLKTLKYYNNQPQQSARWFYVSDLKKSSNKELSQTK